MTFNSRQKIRSEELSPRIQRLRGIIKVDSNFDYKKALTEELSKKLATRRRNGHFR